MEEPTSVLEVAKLSKESIRRTLNGIHDRASSVLLFTLQWEELQRFLDQRTQDLKSREDRLVLRENATERRADEVEVRSREVEERFGMIVAREEEFDLKQKVESDNRSRELESIQRSSEELVLFAKSVDDKFKRIEGKHDELTAMGNSSERLLSELKSMESIIRKKIKEIKRKEEEFKVKEKHCFDGIAENKRREERLDKLSQELRRQYELKDKKILEKEKKLQESVEDLMAKDKEFAIKQKLETEILRKRYELEAKLIQEKEKKVEECLKDIAAREKELVAKQNLEYKKRQSDLESSTKLVLLKNSIEEKMKLLDVKQNELECIVKLTEKQLAEVKSLETRVKDKLHELKQEKDQVRLKEKHLRQCSEDLELEGKRHEELRTELRHKEKNLEESFQQLRGHEEHLDKKLLELELREKKLEDLSKQHQLQANIAVRKVKPEPADSFSGKSLTGHSADADIRFYITMDGRNLQIFLNEHCNEHSSLAAEVAVVLQQSSDPAKLVLDAMEGFYPPFLKKGDQAFEGDIARRSCILLLDQLRVLSPEIKPHVKEQAMKIALTWISEVRSDVTDPLKVLGFLQLLASYNLSSSFDTDEICNLLLRVAGHHQAKRILHSLGFEKISALIEYLVQGKQYVKAINFICSFELVKEFPPVPLLEQFFAVSSRAAKKIYKTGKRTPIAKVQADSFRISYLKAIVICVEKNKLESKYSPTKLKNNKILIARLEKELIAGKAKLNNLKKNAKNASCGQSENANGRSECHKQSLDDKLDSLKQNQNVKQTLKDAASTPLCGSVKSEKSIGNKRSLASISVKTDTDNAVAGHPTLSVKKVAQTFPGPGDSLEGHIEQLIEKDRILQAVKHIFQAHMTDKFHPVPLLTNHLESRRNAFKELFKKDDLPVERKVTELNKMMGAIRAVIKCIEVHKLESAFPMGALHREIADLEKRKEEKCREIEKPTVKGDPRSILNSKKPHQQHGKKGCAVNATAAAAASVMPVAANPTPATPTESAPAPALPIPTAVAADANCKISSPPSTAVVSPQTSGATDPSGSDEQGKRNCIINETAVPAAPMTSSTVAIAPGTPSPSAAPPGGAGNTAAPISPTGDPVKGNGGTHVAGPQQHPNKRQRTAASAAQYYSLSGHPSRNVHPSQWYNGVSPHYSFYMLGRPNWENQWDHHADPRSSFAQPQYYRWRGPPHSYGY